MTDLTVENYSDKCIVVRGDTKTHQTQLKQMGGKWNARLRDGGGWIFPKKLEDTVLQYVSSGKEPEAICEYSDLFFQIEKEIEKMSSQQRLDFLSRITMIASTKKQAQPPRARAHAHAQPSKQDEDSDVSDSDEEEQVPRKRLLR